LVPVLFYIMKLFWSTTGDELLLDACNKEFSEFWLSSLDKDNTNYFKLVESNFDIECQQDLYANIKIISDILVSKFKLTTLEQFLTLDLLNQSTLNELHHDWVLLTHSYPNLPIILKSIDLTIFEAWNKINKLLHSIENDINLEYCTFKEGWEVKNPIGIDILNFNRCQISIGFSQLGRTTYSKWLNFDNNISDIDTNDYLQIGGEIHITVSRPIFQSAPTEYKNFCDSNNIPTVGDKLNLANFTNYEINIATIRELIIKNLKIKNNLISFTYK